MAFSTGNSKDLSPQFPGNSLDYSIKLPFSCPPTDPSRLPLADLRNRKPTSGANCWNRCWGQRFRRRDRIGNSNSRFQFRLLARVEVIGQVRERQ